MAGRSNGLSPDRALEISLIGTAARLHDEGVPPADIITQLRHLALGRADVLSKAAASHLGRYLARAGMSHPATVTIAGYLIQAGADPQTIADDVDQVRKNATGSSYTL